MLGSLYKWCHNGCGKTVISTLKEYQNTKKRLYVCSKCDAKYILDGRNIIKVEGNK